MSDEIIDAPVNVSDAHVPGAPAPTAATTPADSAPAIEATDGDTPPADGGEEGDKPKTPASVQKSINRLTRQRADAERRAMRAEAMLEATQSLRTPPQQQAPSQGSGLKQSDFATYEDFIDARTRAAVKEELAATQRESAQSRAAESASQQTASFIKEATAQATAAGIDFEDAWETLTSAPKVSPAVAGFLFEAEHKAALADHLAKNPDELARLSDLQPITAVRELARLEMRLSTKAAPRTSNAPPPPPTVGGRSTAQADPRKMSMNDFAKWLDAQE